MKNKKPLILFVVLLVILAVALYFVKTPAQLPVVDQQNNIQIIGEIYTYVDVSTNQELKVSYDNTNNTAIIYPNEVNKVVFNATTTGSGARYSNDEQGLILWNKGDDVSLYLNDSLIFTGTIKDNISSTTNATSTKKDSVDLTKNTWVWKETVLNDGQKINPKQTGKFTLTFKDGQVIGTTDCNSFGGNYEATNLAFKFGALMATEMACLNSQEVEFHQMINKISSYSIDKNNVLVFKTVDESLIIFEKK